MKMTSNRQDENMESQMGPKLRNINEEKEVPEEKPKGADVRLKVCAIIVLAIILFVVIKGTFTKSSLMAQIKDQQKQLEEIKEEALQYGITEDEDGNLITPDIESDIIPDAGNIASEEDRKVLDSFTEILLHWKGQSGYNKARQTLIEEWGFSDNCKLLTTFMPETNEDLDANMDLSRDYSVFLLSEDDESTAYFLICPVRNTIDGTSASGIVGIQIKLNKDHAITNVTAQTLS